MRSTLVLVQMSLSFVLLVGAGLLIQSLQAVRSASPGFSTEGVLTTGVDLFTAGYDAQRAKNFQDELIDRLQALGGVQSAAFSRMTPFSYRSYSTAPIAVDGYDAPPDQQPTADYNEIGPGFLATMGIPLVVWPRVHARRQRNGAAGRDRGRDDGRAVLARRGSGRPTRAGEGPMDADRRRRAQTSKYRNLLETPKPFFYVPLRQNFSATTALQIRTTQGPAALAPSLVREIHALDANVAPSELITMREQVERTTAAQRIAVTILVVFGGLALVLAAIGLYGVMASTVSQSSRELALRMALGASASDLLRLVLSKGLASDGGRRSFWDSAAALQSTRLMGYLLYQVSPRDPLAFAIGVRRAYRRVAHRVFRARLARDADRSASRAERLTRVISRASRPHSRKRRFIICSSSEGLLRTVVPFAVGQLHARAQARCASCWLKTNALPRG